MSPKKQASTRKTSLYRLNAPAGPGLDLHALVEKRYRDREGFTASPVDHAGVVGLLVTGSIERERAEWCDALSELTGADVQVAGRTSSGLLLVSTEQAVYAVTYGMGHHMIDPARLDLGFGLQFALRSLDQDGINLVRRHLMDTRGRTDENSAARGGSLRDLGTEWIGSIVSKITGTAIDLPFTHTSASRRSLGVSCTDSSISLPLGRSPQQFLNDLRVIEDACTQPTPLPGLESLARVRSLSRRGRTAVVKRLNEQLDLYLGDPHATGLALNYPGECAAHVTETRAVRIMRGSRVIAVDDVDIGDIRQFVRDRPDGRRLSTLKDVRVQLFADEECREPLSPAIPGHRWITAEVRSGAAHHFYWQGSWYEIGAEFVQALRDDVTELLNRPSGVVLPAWPVGRTTDEDWFNKEAAKQPGYDLFDKKNVHTGTFRGGGLEICDVLGPEGQLIMVKKADKGSSSLSHLCAQVRTAVEALRYDVEVREKFLGRVAELRPNSSPEDILATPTVVLAIRLKYGVPITADSLFAFSQVTLLQTALALQGMGAKAEVVPVYA
ncbi:DUF6119 family protein [Streptomyces sp. NPDC002669]|uniref:DUF6119 family protein n=1 Tax=Streptomyces sp. NPDC002669 TaxID=3364658 RepID=UPI0036AA7186